MQEIIYKLSDWKRFSDMQTAKLEKRFKPFTIEIHRLDAVSRSQQEYIFGVIYPHLREALKFAGYNLENIDEYQFDYFMRKMFYFDIVTTSKGEEKIPRRLNFAKGKKHEVSCVEENGEFVINFEGQWYRNVDDFFKKATIGDSLLTDIIRDLDNFVLAERD